MSGDKKEVFYNWLKKEKVDFPENLGRTALWQLGKLYEIFVHKRVFGKYQSQSEVI